MSQWSAAVQRGSGNGGGGVNPESRLVGVICAASGYRAWLFDLVLGLLLDWEFCTFCRTRWGLDSQLDDTALVTIDGAIYRYCRQCGRWWRSNA